jgi:hypothetical protein
VYRWVFGGLALAAVVTGFDHSVVHNGFSWVSYFSFFTILSNILALSLMLGGAWPVTPGPAWPWFDFLRGAATVYMVITGVVYALLLSQYPVNGPAWVNHVEHQVMPIVVMLDWLIMPPAARIGLRRAMGWLVIPIVYVAYTEIRGPSAHWYPYPFLDPRPHGVVHVVVYSVVIAIAFVAVSAGVAAAGDYFGARRAAART